MQVKIWFQNRRTKWKKAENISNAEAARIMKEKLGGKSKVRMALNPLDISLPSSLPGISGKDLSSSGIKIFYRATAEFGGTESHGGQWYTGIW